jgi:hypothetical protein
MAPSDWDPAVFALESLTGKAVIPDLVVLRQGGGIPRVDVFEYERSKKATEHYVRKMQAYRHSAAMLTSITWVVPESKLSRQIVTCLKSAITSTGTGAFAQVVLFNPPSLKGTFLR